MPTPTTPLICQGVGWRVLFSFLGILPNKIGAVCSFLSPPHMLWALLSMKGNHPSCLPCCLTARVETKEVLAAEIWRPGTERLVSGPLSLPCRGSFSSRLCLPWDRPPPGSLLLSRWPCSALARIGPGQVTYLLPVSLQPTGGGAPCFCLSLGAVPSLSVFSLSIAAPPSPWPGHPVFQLP